MQSPWGACMQLDDPNAQINPYAPPSDLADMGSPGFGDDADQQILAGRGTRLGARILDGLLLLAAMIPAIIAVAATGALSAYGRRGGAGLGEMLLIMGVAMLLVPMPLIGYQWYLLTTR